MHTGKVKTTIFFLFAALVLTSCAGAPFLPGTPEEVTEEIKVVHDPYNGTWTVYTPFYYSGLANGWYSLMRAGGTRQNVNFYQVYVLNKLSESASFDRALDIDGNKLDISVVERKVGSSFGKDTFEEHVVVNLSREYLEAHRERPIQFKLYGKLKTSEVEIAPQMISGFLHAVDLALETK